MKVTCIKEGSKYLVKGETYEVEDYRPAGKYTSNGRTYNRSSYLLLKGVPSRQDAKKFKMSNGKLLSEYTREIKNNPSIFVANEFFDSIAIKQLKRKKNSWYEKFVNIRDKDKAFFFEKEIDIKKIEKKINFKISRNQNFIEYSELGLNYLQDISKLIKKNTGGLLIIDYGYTEKKMKDTLQAISNHKFANILDNIGSVDITHNISFDLFKRIVKKIDGLENYLTTQKKFLLKMGIMQRAELIVKNQKFSKKADIYYRVKRLIDEKQMGNLFKVMFIKNQNNKFKLGF